MAVLTWKRLEDVRGSCDSCAMNRPLTVEHVPTSAWICQQCFHTYWRDRDAPAA
jgi:ribosomal protein L37AE/L43A